MKFGLVVIKIGGMGMKVYEIKRKVANFFETLLGIKQKRQRNIRAAQVIGECFLDEQPDNSKESYNRAINNIMECGITNLQFVGKNKVVITTTRPGLVIGRRGTFISKIRAKLEEEFKTNILVDVKENQVIPFLIPYYPDIDYSMGVLSDLE